MAQIKCLLWNLENLFVLLDEPVQQTLHSLPEKSWKNLSTSIYKNKPLHKLFGIEKMLKKENPDVVLCVEVGGLESLANLSKYFLGDEYEAYLLESNSDRAIDLGFLVRRNVGFEVKLRTNKELRLLNLSYIESLNVESGYAGKTKEWKFSRDVCEMDLSLNGDLIARFLLTHLKSKREVKAIDPKSRDRRRAEVQGLVQVYQLLEKQTAADIPIFVCGDMNGQAAGNDLEEDFLALHTTALKDVFELFDVEERATFFSFRGRKFKPVQLDYIFVEPKFKQKFCYPPKVLKYTDAKGNEQTLPPTTGEKMNWPSDHLPIVFEFNS